MALTDMGANDVAGAAKLAAESPQGFLRTPQTIQRFQQIPGQQGQPQAESREAQGEVGGRYSREACQWARLVCLGPWPLVRSLLEAAPRLRDAALGAETLLAAMSRPLSAPVAQRLVELGEWG